MDAPRLPGRSVVVTGCTRGFGRALVRRLAAAGAGVVVSGPFRDETDELVADLRDAGWAAVGTDGDVTDRDQMAELAATAVAEYGRLDVWVNNAAFETPGMQRSIDLGDEVFDAVLEVNVRGTYNGSMAALRVMREQGGGVIVNVTGRGDDLRSAAFTAPYGASKSWIRSFSRTLRSEYLREGVQVVAFNPGVMSTARMDHGHLERLAELDPRQAKLYPVVMRVLTDPPEIAAERLTTFLATDGPAKHGELRLITPAKLARGLGHEAQRWAQDKVGQRRG